MGQRAENENHIPHDVLQSAGIAPILIIVISNRNLVSPCACFGVVKNFFIDDFLVAPSPEKVQRLLSLENATPVKSVFRVFRKSVDPKSRFSTPNFHLKSRNVM
jgi:hypothetical protein